MHLPLRVRSIRNLLASAAVLLLAAPASADPLEDSPARLGERVTAQLDAHLAAVLAEDLERWMSDLGPRAVPASAAAASSRMQCVVSGESLTCTVRPPFEANLASVHR